MCGYTVDDVGFVIARILWIAMLGEDPYRVPGTPSDYDNIWTDRRRPWAGPPALGRLLEQVLVVDNRLPVAQFRDAPQTAVATLCYGCLVERCTVNSDPGSVGP